MPPWRQYVGEGTPAWRSTVLAKAVPKHSMTCIGGGGAVQSPDHRASSASMISRGRHADHAVAGRARGCSCGSAAYKRGACTIPLLGGTERCGAR